LAEGGGHDHELHRPDHRFMGRGSIVAIQTGAAGMTPAEWGQVGIGGVLSAFVTAVGAYFVKRADRVQPEALTVPQIETITKGLGELIDDLQHERRENRHIIRNLRMELDGLRERLEKAEASNTRLGFELAGLRLVLAQCEEFILAHGLTMPMPLSASAFQN
jgi:hypothetical protein